MDLDSLLKNIASGVPVKAAQLLPYLCLESAEQRCQVNVKLAEAYAGIQDFEQAKVFVQRAWVLSEFSEDLLPLYLEIHAALGDIVSIQAAYKRLGMKKAAENNIAEAIEYFNLSMYAYACYQKLDRYVYDFDILERIEQTAKPYRFHPGPRRKPLEQRKTRVAYLMFGMAHTNSVVVRINLLFAQFHDKSLFDIAFFVPEPESAVHDKNIIQLLRDHNCKVVTAPEAGGEAERMLWVATQIYNFTPDLLVFNALLADLKHYFIASLHPALFTLGFSYGPPSQFAAHNLDWSITWAKHPLIDSPCDGSLVDLEIDLPERTCIQFYAKQQFNIPANSLILMSGGRYPKFQEPRFWKAILDVMHSHPDVYYVVIGVLEEELSFLKELLAPELKTRLRFLGWREDYLRILGLANIVIDTFPSGGGVVLMDAMALGIPVVSFKNNYMRSFDQTDWSLAEEVIEIPDLIVERANFEQFTLVVSKLIDDRKYRMKMARLCKEQIHLKHGNPERMVRRCESIYLRIVENRLREKALPVSVGYSFLSRLKTALKHAFLRLAKSYETLAKEQASRN